MPAKRQGVKRGVAVFAALGWVVALAIRTIGQQSVAPAAFICPMHPDVVARAAGSCPRCGMALVVADPYDAREFLVDVAATPTPRAGAATRLRFTVREPATHAVVRELVEVHEKRYHLFVIGQDLEHYDHVHPQRGPDGSYTVTVTLPRPGYYKLYSDFLPFGGAPQVVARTIATADFAGTLASQRAHLTADENLTKTIAGLRVSLTLPADGLVAGRDEKLQYHIVDAITGAAVVDLEPYLAAFGHTLAVSDDTLQYIHAHPFQAPSDPTVTPLGGPDLTFKALLPKPGLYRVWTQLKRRGVVSTVSFTLKAVSPSGR